jgi:hypothetical protein
MGVGEKFAERSNASRQHYTRALAATPTTRLDRLTHPVASFGEDRAAPGGGREIAGSLGNCARFLGIFGSESDVDRSRKQRRVMSPIRSLPEASPKG